MSGDVSADVTSLGRWPSLSTGTNVEFGFAAYQSRYEIEGNQLRYSRKYVLKDLSVPVDKIDRLRSFENLVAADEQARVILKRTE